MTDVKRMTLAQLRKKVGMTQKEVAVKMGGMDLGNLSRLERADDHLLSTLRKYVEALGGKLDIVMVFDDEISNCIKLE